MREKDDLDTSTEIRDASVRFARPKNILVMSPKSGCASELHKSAQALEFCPAVWGVHLTVAFSQTIDCWQPAAGRMSNFCMFSEDFQVL